MLSTDEFVEWSKKVVLFLHNTSRVDDEPYPDLLREKGANGFPTVSYLDADGNLLKQVGHFTPVDQLEEVFAELQRWKALRAEVEKGGAGAAKEKELFFLELDMGNRPWEEMRRRAQALSISSEESKDVARKLVNLHFVEILRRKGRDLAGAGAELLPMFQAGEIPDSSQETTFWQALFEHAYAAKNSALYKQVLAVLKVRKAGDPRLDRYLGMVEKRLEELDEQARQKDGGGK
ncbi:MAG: hypothetical protein Fur0037_16970 [Planctomycetota bacterium]